MPELSVLLPVYRPNKEYLREALLSVQAQTWEEFACVIVEAEPNGITEGLLVELNDRRFALEVVAEANLVRQLNQGLSRITSSFTARMDADDICEPERFEKQLTFLKNYPEVAVVGSSLTIIHASSKATGTRMYPTEPKQVKSAMRQKNSLAHPSVMFRTEVVRKLGGYSDRYPCAEDYSLWSRLIQSGHGVANVPECLLRYRLHPAASKSQQLKTTLRSTLKIKRDLWWKEMDLVDRGRYYTESALLLLPSSMIYSLFRWKELR